MTLARAHSRILLVAVGLLAAHPGTGCGREPGERRPGPGSRARRADAAVLVPVAVEDEPDAAVKLPIADEKEPNHWPEQANPIAPGTAARGVIGYPLTATIGDRDLYLLTVPGTGPLVLRAEVTGVPGLKLEIDLRTADWVSLDSMSSAAPGKGAQISNLSLAPGKYFVVVRESRGGPPYFYDRSKPYLLTVRLHAAAPGEEREPNDRHGDANLLVPGVEVRGLVGRPGDVDYYRVPLAGLDPTSLLSVSFTGVPGVTVDVAVLDYARKVVNNRPGVRGAAVSLRDLAVKPHTGWVYVVVTGQQRYSADERYRLRVDVGKATESREKEPNDHPAQAVTLAGPKGEMKGNLEVGSDVDYYYLPLAGLHNLRLRLEVPPALDGKLTLYTHRGMRILETNVGKAGEEELLSNLRVTGGVYVKVGSVGGTADAQRPYTLSWSAAPADKGDEVEPNDTRPRASTIAPGVSAKGFIYPQGDVDLYVIRLQGFTGQTEKVRIALQGIPDLRLAFELLDDQDNVLAKASLATSEGLREVTTTIHVAQTYVIKVFDATGRGVNAKENYELNLGLVRP
jgi:hypothetical protein